MLVTSGLVLTVLGITKGEDWGWSSGLTIGVFAGAAALLAAFGGWELRHPEPLMPLGIFRLRTLTAANVSGLILGTALFAMFLMLTLYMQQVLGYSPLRTGVAYLAVAGTSIIWANVAAQAVNRVGVKPALVFGMAMMTIGLVYFTRVSVHGSYWADLFPGFLIIGLGIPFAFIPITIAAVAGTKPEEAGLASGLINTAQQIGGALGIAVLATVANSTITSDRKTGVAVPNAFTHGFQNAFWVGAGVAAVGVLVAVLFVRRSDLAPSAIAEHEVEAAAEAA
jgi:predicted MFS family arabinose efflux permease